MIFMLNFRCCSFQDNYNVLHIASMYSREDVVKTLLAKKGVDPFATGGVRNKNIFVIFYLVRL